MPQNNPDFENQKIPGFVAEDYEEKRLQEGGTQGN